MVQSLELSLPAAIVFVSRLSVRTLIHNELRSRSVFKITTCESLAACLTALSADPTALLIVDSDQDERELVQSLRAAQGHYRIDTRPIYLIAYAASEKILSYAIEYNILQLHKGELSKAQFELNFGEMMHYSLRTPLQLDVFDKVVKAKRAERRDEVYALLLSLWKAEPDNIQAADELGLALCDLDQWDDAELHLIEIVAKFPFDTRAKHLLARCFMKKTDFERARYYLEQASLLSPFNAERLCDLGQVLLDEYHLAEALGTFREALALEPDLQAAKVGKTQCELLLGEANEALKMIRQMQDPFEFASVFNGAAIVAVRAGYFSQGIGLYQTATGYLLEYPSLMSRVFFNMGIGLWKWGKGSLAVAAFEKAVELDGSNAKAKHNADRLSLSMKKRSSSAHDDSEGPFNALNRIDTMDDFDEITEEGFPR